MSGNIEFETKVLKIDPIQVALQLLQLRAIEQPETLSRRFVFDLSQDKIEWIRLRQTGKKVTMTYKYKVVGNTEVGQPIEIEVEVSDFEKTAQILRKLPFKKVFYQENKNHIFHLNDIEFSIDTWPMLDPYLEIEAKSKDDVQKGLALLGLTGQDVGDKDIKEIYAEKGIRIHDYNELKF